MKNILVNKSMEYNILDKVVNIISNDTCYGFKSVMELDDKYYHLSDDLSIFSSILLLCQSILNRDFSNEELILIINQNKYAAQEEI